MNRRQILASLSGAASMAVLPRLATASTPFVIEERFIPRIVGIRPDFDPGTIVIEMATHHLYLVQDDPRRAIRYGVGLGKAGLEFRGEAVIGRKAKWPFWKPTAEMIRRSPKYAKYADGMPGGPNNPLGSRALYLYRNGRDTLFRIHGTTQPSSIGRSVSNGCIRMINDHVADLYERVPTGTRVIVG